MIATRYPLSFHTLCCRLIESRTFTTILVGVVTLLVFAGVRNADFLVWDDLWVIVNNPIAGLSLGSIGNILTNVTPTSGSYTPLFGLRLATIDQFWGRDPHVFHLVNLAFHVVDAMLAVLVIHAIFRFADNKAELWIQNVAALFAALLWALHPLRVEAVAWIASGSYGQASFFLLISLLLLLRNPGSTSSRTLAAVAYGAAVLTQPMTLGFICIPFLIQYWNNRHSEITGKFIFSLIREGLPFIIIAALISICDIAINIYSPGGSHYSASLDKFGIFSRVMQSLFILAYYVWRPFAPFGLSPVYPYFLPFIPFSWSIITSAISVLAAGLVLLILRKRYTFLFVCGVAYFFLLIPFLSFTEMKISPADRHSFVASFLGSVILAFLIVLSGNKWRGWIIGVCLVISVWVATLTVQQIHIWDDTEKLMRNIIVSLKDRPNEPYLGFIHVRLGKYLWSKGDAPGALNEYALAIAISPNKHLTDAIISICESNQLQSPGDRMTCSQILQRLRTTTN